MIYLIISISQTINFKLCSNQVDYNFFLMKYSIKIYNLSPTNVLRFLCYMQMKIIKRLRSFLKKIFPVANN